MAALVAARGSPGVTVSALALTLGMPGRCLLAECDPAGGDILPGYLQGSLPPRRGLAPLAVAQLRGRLREEFAGQLVDLDPPGHGKLLLPGLSDPAQAATAATLWEPLADQLHGLSRDGWRVLVDCGRLPTAHLGWPLLRRADLVLLVVRGTLPSISAAVPAVRNLRGQVTGRLGLLLVGGGPYGAGDVARGLDVEVLARLPDDPRTARRLSLGGAVPGRSALLRAAAGVKLAPAPPGRPAGAPDPPGPAGVPDAL
jgi:hypothetical protein